MIQSSTPKPKREINNVGYASFSTSTVANTDEMEALDQFGPYARDAIRNAPLLVLAKSTLEIILDDYEKLKEKHPNLPDAIDLKRPDVDKRIAYAIMAGSYHLLLKDREPNDERTTEERERDAALGVKPLIPKRIVRSVR
jgi:hypothetical protein